MMMQDDTALTIALSKGRIYSQALPLLKQAGIEPLEDPDITRKLVLKTSKPNVKLIVIRATDVPTYVEWGAADLGVAGKDVLMEYEGQGLYEPLDLKIARCRMIVAGKPGASLTGERSRIATKYVRSTRRHFAARGQQVEIIKLYGSMELAPLAGLADLIVDLVESGNTLKVNGLQPLETICNISSRLIINKAAWKMKHKPIIELTQQLHDAVIAGANS